MYALAFKREVARLQARPRHMNHLSEQHEEPPRMHHGSNPVSYEDYNQQWDSRVGAMEHGGEALGRARDGRRQDGRERGNLPKKKRNRGERSKTAGFESLYTHDPNLGPEKN